MRWRWWPPIALAAMVLAAGFAALDQYNVNWDEALGDLFFGQRYLSFFLSFDHRYLDYAGDPYPPGHTPDLSASPFRDRPWEYYPLANVLAAGTSRVLSGWLGLVDPFDGFHAFNVFVAALFAGLFYVFVGRRLGEMEAWVAVGLLFLSPRVVCHLMANIKDFPEMVLYAATLLAFCLAYEARSVRGIVLVGLLWGAALATKANALFIAPTVGLFVVADWLVSRRAGKGRTWHWRERGGALFGALCAAAGVGLVVVLAVWPYLWEDPVGHLLRHLRYVAGQVFQVRSESLSDPLQALVLTTPPLFLLLAVVGLGLAVRRALGGEHLSLLVLVWVGVVLGRLYLPGAVNFDGVRHFLELFPALAIAAGLAAGDAWRRFPRLAAGRLGRRPSPALAVVFVLLVLATPLAAVMRTHPHEIAYWNGLGGGLAGARARGIAQAGDYWGMSYRQGLRWIRDNAPPGAILAVPVIEHAVALVAPDRLRADVGLAALTLPVRPEIPPQRLAMLREVARQRLVLVMFVRRDDWQNALMRECRERLQPVASWSVDDEPILEIYDYSAAP